MTDDVVREMLSKMPSLQEAADRAVQITRTAFTTSPPHPAPVLPLDITDEQRETVWKLMEAYKDASIRWEHEQSDFDEFRDRALDRLYARRAELRAALGFDDQEGSR